MDFKGKTIVVTGAASQIGIGRATALAFAKAGARLALCDLDGKGLHQTEAQVADCGAEVLAQVADVADTAAVNAFVSAAQERFGGIDSVICNAGIARRKAFAELTDDDIHAVMNTNFGGCYRLIRAAAPAMHERGGGSAICLSSVMGGAWGWKEHASYSASKAAIEGLVRALAVELGPQNIRVNAIAPGAIRTAQSTDSINSVGEDGLAAMAEMVPLRRVGKPEEIAAIAMLLASDYSSYLTGQTLVVDGGITLGDLG